MDLLNSGVYICVFKIYVTGAVNTSFFCNTELKNLNFNTNLSIFIFFFMCFKKNQVWGMKDEIQVEFLDCDASGVCAWFPRL